MVQHFEESHALLAHSRIRVSKRLVEALNKLVEQVAVFALDKFGLLLELVHQLQARGNQVTRTAAFARLLRLESSGKLLNHLINHDFRANRALMRQV
eukprot:CAMPEP_0170472844 /NCGR_PEP_ID=MMETSP0123-20130129/14832_1 /TAXON_ID=182087 /ORGANISM="Favella ehrenbergii, Strain Fehren 1" /LENGTH=96 /DNA_ID=CAMNT_0010741435 /DNA_START=2356 /DNA_END=2646 /DNA_ORIENTATION=-